MYHIWMKFFMSSLIYHNSASTSIALAGDINHVQIHAYFLSNDHTINVLELSKECKGIESECDGIDYVSVVTSITQEIRLANITMRSKLPAAVGAQTVTDAHHSIESTRLGHRSKQWISSKDKHIYCINAAVQ